MTVRDFEHQFRILYMPLGMYALRIVGDIDEAEDRVQDAFAKAWEMIEGGMEIPQFKAWMYRSVRNTCIDHLRAKKVTVDILALEGESTDEAIDTSERDAAVWRAIDRLPDKCREIFLMSKRDGLSNEEIAEELGLSVKTVKNQMTKAFARLREALGEGHRPFFLPFL
ncbi:MAG: RNA polymerase sigma-70 factor [Muribaculaceae bacterium]|nr:RNA polymerase sigma-70 factor [Muribaculaceae bacterium]